MTCLENILYYYNSLRPKNSTKAILRLMLSHLNNLEDMNIQQLADVCYTSPSTISRIIKELGFKSFYAFRSELAICLHQYRHHNRFSPDPCSSGQDAMAIVSRNMDYVLSEYKKLDPSQFETIADALHGASSVSIFSYNILFMENTLQSDLLISGIPCEIVCGNFAQMEKVKQLQENDLALFMYPEAVDSSNAVRKTIDAARKQGATICVFSSTDDPTSLGRCDHLMAFPGKRHMVDSYLLEMMLSTLAMVYRNKYIDHQEP